MEQFAGFTNSQFKTILNKLGYESNSLQTDEVNAFLAANPNASAKLGQYTMIARQMVSNKGKPRRGFSPGGGVEGKQAEIAALAEHFYKTGRIPPDSYPAFHAELAIINQKYYSALFTSIMFRFLAGVAQLVRALDCGSGGRGFEPHRSPHQLERNL